ETRHWPRGVEPVRADLSNPASIGAAADGCESAFLYVQGPATASVHQLRAAGVKRITVLSTIDAADRYLGHCAGRGGGTHDATARRDAARADGAALADAA